ncbi:MAG: hypothetical protein ACE5IR_27260, partial [bacterium]
KARGILLYQHIKYSPTPRFHFTARMTFFDTESFDARIFQYENDLPGVITNRGLFGKGSRWFILVKIKPFKYTEMNVKYSETYRDDVETIGSGPDLITGRLDRRIAVQLDTKF